MIKKSSIKAFTLVEILAVIAILGILTTTILASINLYIETGKNDYNKGIEKTLLVSGKNYYSENKKEEPNGINKLYSFITVKEMLAQNYMSKKMIDADENDCSSSFVIATKTGRYENTKYTPCLKCGNKYYYDGDSVCSGIDSSYKGKAKICKIENYKVTELKNSDGTSFENFKNLIVAGSDGSGTIDIRDLNRDDINKKLSDYLGNLIDGEYQIKATNIGGSTISCGTISLKSECEVTLTNKTTNEKLENYTDDTDNNSVIYTNDDVNVEMKCIGETCSDGVKFKNASCMENDCNDQKNNGDWNTFTDKVDRTIKCDVHPRIDKVSPRCGYGDWSKTSTSLNIEIYCMDDDSGCEQNRFKLSQAINTTGLYTFTQQIEDKAGNTATCSKTINLSKPTASLTRKSGSLDYVGTGKDADGIVEYKFSNNSDPNYGNWEKINTVNSITKTKTTKVQKTSGRYLYFHVKNVNGATATAKAELYKQCQEQKATGYDINNAKAYKFTYDKRNCKKSNTDLGTHTPYRKYDFKIYYCDCDIDKYNKNYCGYNGAKNMTNTTEGHRKTLYAAIFYQNTDNGVKACNGDNPINSYVYSVCNQDFTPFNSKNPKTEDVYHGYNWYKYNSVNEKYNSFKSGWYHTGKNKDDRVANDASAGAACKKACELTYYKGEVE